MSGGQEANALWLEEGQRGVVGRLVGVALVVRLVTLAVSMVGLVGEQLTLQALLAVLLLAGTSLVGLLGRRVLEVVLRHPSLAMFDVLLVLGVLIVLGVGSPLTLATFSTALLIGVLFPAHLAVLLGFCLACGYIGVLRPQRGIGSIDGDSFFIVVGIPVTYACLVGIGQSFRWIAGQQAATERALRDIGRAAAAAEERARLAREMHDSFAKTLQGIALGCAALATWIHRDPNEAAAQANALGSAADHAVRQARDLLSHLRRDRPGDPFADVVAQTCGEWSGRHGVPCAVEVALSRDPAPNVRYQLLAAMCEALENTARHAQARRVHLILRGDDGEVAIVVRDDGIGFDPATLGEREREGHFGLRGMRERLEDLGGAVTVETAPGFGTTITLRAPTRLEEDRDLERIG